MLTLSREQFKTLFHHASKDTIAINLETGSLKLSDPKPQRHAPPALDGGASGEDKSAPRTRVSIVRFACRLLDQDNLTGGTKPVIDGLKEAGLILDDSPDKIELHVRQEKVWNKDDQRTEIEIDTPDEYVGRASGKTFE